MTTKGNYSPADLSRTLLLQPREQASETTYLLHYCFPRCTCKKFTHRTLNWTAYLRGQNSLCTQMISTNFYWSPS